MTIENRLDQGLRFLVAVDQVLQENKQLLGQYDAVAGDGDHGINMAKGAALALAAAVDGSAVTIGDGYRILGDTLLSEIGGSMGPLYGRFFLGLAGGAPEGDHPLTASQFAGMLAAGLTSVRLVTAAQIGDKTMIDALEPAVKAALQAADSGAELRFSIRAMVKAANDGLAHTAKIPARVGRAVRAGDRSLGHVDAGAASCALLLQVIATSYDPTLEVDQ